ncbi:MAG: YidC/Oxa1 family membrane protein insertase [Firmicutes bacterium]|nr:YidC/Oxa1 family membrane protein insertase [[Eubacterium] siraeum]MCM1487267.1 YidC/Oxa1 family membrane protein insertase [Bacillota bacterium]
MISIDFLYSVLGTPIGYIMWVCYLLVNNFGWAMVIFAVIVKLAMFPLTLKQQKNMAKSQLFTPKMQELQKKYANNKEKYQEELAKLQQEGYNPMGGCGTMLLTFVLLFGVIDVVYKPMTHMEHLNWGDGNGSAVSTVVDRAKQADYALTLLSSEGDLKVYLEYLDDTAAIKTLTQEDFDKLNDEAKETAVIRPKVEISDPDFNITEAKKAVVFTKEDVMNNYGLSEEQWDKLISLASNDTAITALTDKSSRISDQVKNELNAIKNQKFVSLRQELAALRVYTDHKEAFSGIQLSQETLDKLENLSNNMQFMGMDLGMTPGFEFPLLLIPILSLIMSLAQTVITQIIQKKSNPEMAAQQQGCANVAFYIMPLFSLYIAFQVPAGVGMYWALGYLIGIIQTLIIQKFWPVEKLKEEARKELAAKNKTVTATAVVTDVDEEGNTVKVERKMSDMSAKEIKEYQRKKLEEARKADAEKYGDEFIPDLPPLEEDEEETESSQEDGDKASDKNSEKKSKK